MKTQNEKRLVEMEGFEEDSHQFKIKQNARAFEILSSNIYSDKILAVVREIGCNARDAHTMNGKSDVPFDVHLPNSMEPWFAIRDYGPGLSHQDVMNLYTTYFESTKADTNDAIGCLGLGSKSPFAYTDQFSVTSRFKGIKRVYSLYVDEAGAPAITPLTEEKTTEPSGLEVQMSVKSNDYEEFASRAKKVFSRFSVKPNVTGKHGFEFTKYSYVYESKDKKSMVRDTDGTYDSKCYAIQGGVAYPIDSSELGLSSDYNSKDKKIIRLLEDGGVDFIFDMGDVNITASRERLNYDKATRLNITSRIKSFLKEIHEDLNSEIQAAKTAWDATKVYRKYTGGRMGHMMAALDKPTFHLNIAGRNIGSEFTINRIVEEPMLDAKNQPMFYPTTNGGTLKPMLQRLHTLTFEGYNHDSLRKDRPTQPYKHGVAVQVDPNDPPKFVLVDKERHMMHRLIRSNFKPTDRVLVIRPSKVNTIDELIKDLGIPKELIILSSTLDMPKIERVKKPAELKLYKARVSRWGNFRVDQTVTLTEETNKGGEFLLVHHLKPVSPKHQDDATGGPSDYDPIALLGVMHEYNIGGGDKKPFSNLYAGNHHVFNQIKDDPQWVSVHDIVRNYWNKEINSKEFLKVAKSVKVMQEVGRNTWLKAILRFWMRQTSDHKFVPLSRKSHFSKVGEELMLNYNTVFNYLNKRRTTGMNEITEDVVMRFCADDMDRIVKALTSSYDISSPKFIEAYKHTIVASTISDTLKKYYPALRRMFQSYTYGPDSSYFTFTDVKMYIMMCDNNKKFVERIMTNGFTTPEKF